MLNYGLAGRSQNVLFNLYPIYPKIEYKKINIFYRYSDPLLVLRPDLDSSQDLVEATSWACYDGGGTLRTGVHSATP